MRKKTNTNSEDIATLLLTKGKHILVITLKNFEEREIHLNVLSQQTHIIELKKENKIA